MKRKLNGRRCLSGLVDRDDQVLIKSVLASPLLGLDGGSALGRQDVLGVSAAHVA
jgi:hypothetical protein